MKPPCVSPLKFQYVIVGSSWSFEAHSLDNRSWCVSHPGPLAASNCMSLNTMRSGTSSAATFPSTQAANNKSIAAAKFVEPPQGALCRFRICSTGEDNEGILCHLGWDSNVSTRCRKSASAESDTNSP